MEIKDALALLLLFSVSFLNAPIAQAQGMNDVVWEVNDLHLSKNETYTDSVSLEPYAPHRIEYHVREVNTTVEEPLLVIELNSDKGSTTMRVFHDSLQRNSSYTPRTSNYQLQISNRGYVDTILNLTINQTGEPVPPTTIDIEHNIVPPLVLATLIPMVAGLSGILFYRSILLADSQEREQGQKLWPDPRILACAITLFVFISPHEFWILPDLFEPNQFYILAPIWLYQPNTIPPVMFGFFGDVMGQIVTLLGLLFAYTICGYYKGKRTREEVLLIGILRPVSHYVVDILYQALFWSSPFTLRSSPLPIVFIIGAAAVFLLPKPSESEIWDPSMDEKPSS